MAVSPGGNWMVCGTTVGTVMAWDLRKLDALVQPGQAPWKSWLQVACDRLNRCSDTRLSASVETSKLLSICARFGRPPGERSSL